MTTKQGGGSRREYPLGCICGPCWHCDEGYEDEECDCLEPCPIHQPHAYKTDLSALHPDAEPLFSTGGLSVTDGKP